ncbi:MAG: hypothetical protein F6K42_30210 [Leptolyngbya sp. SIO1D8]|nr:hypothetical protein [Leptolyngbya sp. SIO1D8]
MSLQGLPAFYHPLQVAGGTVYYPFEGQGDFLMLPERLDIATTAEGIPDFRLELIHGKNPFLPPEPYGVLDFKIAPHYALAEGLMQLRQHHPQTTLAPAIFTTGYLYLMLPQGLDAQAQQELSRPQELAWNGLGMARSRLRLSAATSNLLKQALQGDVLMLHARAEMDILGVAPRLPVKVRFNPAALLEALVSMLPQPVAPAPVVARDALVQALRDLSQLPIQLTGESESVDPTILAETLTDWIRVRFGQRVPAPASHQGACMALPSLETVPPGDYTWDLSTPLRCPRPVVLTLDPLRAARNLVTDQGLDAVFHTTIVPPIPTGAVTLEVSANLPRQRQGILAMGAHLYAPPRLPYRAQAIAASIEVSSPTDQASTFLRFAPGEPLAYTVTTYVVTQTATGITRLESTPWPHQGNRLALTVDQFPVEFIPIQASQSLLALASIQGVCRWQQADTVGQQAFALTPEQPEITLALPEGAIDATVEITACDRQSDRHLQLEPRPATGLRLDRIP